MKLLPYTLLLCVAFTGGCSPQEKASPSNSSGQPSPPRQVAGDMRSEDDRLFSAERATEQRDRVRASPRARLNSGFVDNLPCLQLAESASTEDVQKWLHDLGESKGDAAR